MVLPRPLIDWFPPSRTQLLDLFVRRHIDDAMLWEIARADYGHGAEEVFEELQSIQRSGVVPVRISQQLKETLELTRYCDPEQPNTPPFQPGPTGRRGHLIRLFACAVLLRASSAPDCFCEDLSPDATLANCVVSAGSCGDPFNQALACFLTWQFPNSEQPVYAALALLTLACRLNFKRMTELELNQVIQLVLAEDEARILRYGKFDPTDPPPVDFSLQQRLWDPVAVELQATASSVAQRTIRENLELCLLLLHPA